MYHATESAGPQSHVANLAHAGGSLPPAAAASSASPISASTVVSFSGPPNSNALTRARSAAHATPSLAAGADCWLLASPTDPAASTPHAATTATTTPARANRFSARQPATARSTTNAAALLWLPRPWCVQL